MAMVRPQGKPFPGHGRPLNVGHGGHSILA
jgi:hypothetical protein